MRAHQTAQSWLGVALNPLQTQIREHQQMMEQRLETLRKISQSRDTLELKLRELERQRLHLQGQLATLQSLRAALHQAPPQNQPASADNVTPLRAVG